MKQAGQNVTRVAIIAAMPGELKLLTREWQYQRSNGVHLWRWPHDGGEWIAACAGAGVEAATRAFAEIEKAGPVSSVLSLGWAGALRQDLAPGQAYAVSAVIDSRTGERFETAMPLHECFLVTSPKVADAQEKLRLAETYKASLVDMEAAAIARLAQMRGIPFYCLKGVSDGFGEQLPDFNRFILPDGRFRLAPFVVFALLRPWHWPALVRMGENSKRAAKNMAESLLDFLDPRGEIRKRNGYPSFKR
jgi:adenosylhomocysteine nucleosidase